MSKVIRYVAMSFIATLILLSSADTLSAQMLSEGCDLHRTRLIPYPTAAAASQRGLERQRYMQPVVEWLQGENGALQGEYTFPFSWLERQVFLRVEATGYGYEVFVNGKRVGLSTNGYAAAEFNITKPSREDKNRVEIRPLEVNPMAAIECFEAKTEAMPTAYIISQPRVRVREILSDVEVGKSGVANAVFSVVMQNLTLGRKSARLAYEIYLNDTVRLTGGYRDVSLGMHGVDTLRFGATVADTLLWSCDRAQRLSLRMYNRIEGRDVEFYDMPVALRELRYEDGEFRINGEPWGDEWRVMSPNATLAEVAEAVDAGAKALRFTAGCVAEAVLEYCDARGVYVALTAPINSSLSGTSRKKGGNPSNDPAWRESYVERILQLIHSTKRHACVVAYCLADDSANGICLYEGYIAAKKVAGNRPVFYADGGNEWNND